MIEWRLAPPIHESSGEWREDAVALLAALARFARQVRSGRRHRAGRPRLGSLALGLLGLLWLLFVVYTTYSSLPLYLPAGFPDLWPTPGSHALLAVLAAWVVYSALAAFFAPSPAQPRSRPCPVQALTQN